MDRPDNTEFKYFYCNNFKWLNPMDNEARAGHPKEKTIYRGWYNTETKSYRIMSNPGYGILLQNLKEVDNFIFGFTSDFEEITKSNILTFKEIKEDNLSELLQWLEINNADLKERMGFTSQPPNPALTTNQVVHIITNEAAVKEHEQYVGALNGFLESGEELLNINPIAFEKIWVLIDNILDETYQNDPIESYQLKLSNQGLGINISDTYKALGKYTSTDKRINENPDDLYEAITSLVTELIRRDYNNLDK